MAREGDFISLKLEACAGRLVRTLGGGREQGGKERREAGGYCDPERDEPDETNGRWSTTATTGSGVLADREERERLDRGAHPRMRRQGDATGLQPRGGGRDVPPA